MSPVVHRSLRLLALLTAFAAAAPLAAAQRGQPGSLLIFPEFDTRAGNANLVTVTNTHRNESVQLRWVYTAAEDCVPWTFGETLTPNDSLTLLTHLHYPYATRGFLTVYAVVPGAVGAVTFNYLTGTSTVIDGPQGLQYTIEPFVFRGLTGHGNPTDRDGDHLPDLNGREYQPAPGQLLFPRFLGQEPDFLPEFQSALVLLNLTATTTATAEVRFEVYNDNEEVYSAVHDFECWTRATLLDISFVFSNTFLKFGNEDPDEIRGLPAWEAGWFRVDGVQATTSTEVFDDPAVLGVLIDRMPSNSSTLPFTTGRQVNGALYT